MQSGMKRRHGKFRSYKMAGQAPYFTNTRDVSGVVRLPAGRYALIPCTYNPSPVRAQLLA